MAHVVFDVVAEDPEEPHVAEQVHHAAVHENRRQEGQPDGNRRLPQARIRHFHRPLGCLHDPHLRLHLDVLAGNDLGRHLHVGHREVFIDPLWPEALLEDGEHEHVGNDQRNRDERKRDAIGVVVANRKNHLSTRG